MKRFFLSLSAILFLSGIASAQGTLTAADFFGQMQEKYGSSPDFEAGISITMGKTVMSGVISFRSPNLLRIDFSQPSGQVFCFNGEELSIYLPEYAAVLKQSTQNSGAAGAGMASAQGLQLMKRNYSIAYSGSPSPVPLEDGSAEQVIKLSLEAKVVTEGYRRFLLSVNPTTKLIRRMEGTTTSGTTIVFDFTDIRLNQSIPATRFIYDPPPSANMYNNFLYKTD